MGASRPVRVASIESFLAKGQRVEYIAGCCSLALGGPCVSLGISGYYHYRTRRRLSSVKFWQERVETPVSRSPTTRFYRFLRLAASVFEFHATFYDGMRWCVCYRPLMQRANSKEKNFFDKVLVNVPCAR